MKAKVHAAVERAVWDEHENEDYPELYIVELGRAPRRACSLR